MNLLLPHLLRTTLRSKSWVAAGLALGLFSPVLGTLPAIAEGSRQLVDSGGDRAFLEFGSVTNGGIQRRTTIKVYVKSGETINLGSNVIGT